MVRKDYVNLCQACYKAGIPYELLEILMKELGYIYGNFKQAKFQSYINKHMPYYTNLK